MPEEIITSVQSGELVLFCGAGISTEGKTVLPYSFYSSIQEELDMDNPALPFSELMQLYCDQANGRKKLLQAIRKRFQYIHSFPELERQATAFHRELSEIYQIRTIITTNWDTYFEKCCGAIPITIPQDFAFWDDSSRYVIKIHGSINNLGSIIATKDDYQHCYVAHIVKNYDVLAKLQHINQNYWTEAYYIGYSNGLVLIGACDDIFDETIRAFPLFYLPNVKNKIDSIETLIHEIEKTSSPRSKYYRFAKKLVEERGGKDIIMHHPPL